MKKVCLTLIAFICLAPAPPAPEWGFFGHRRINELAVFTLPPELIVFYKQNIDYVAQHAVDADKRRYATRHEAVRHYIDLDHWGVFPFPDLPRDWPGALARHSVLYRIDQKGDTVSLAIPDRRWAIRNILPQYYEDSWLIPCEVIDSLYPQAPEACREAFALDTLSRHGVLPYNLQQMQYRLTQAFLRRDTELILRLSADLGHYIGDAHVPLHTTSNYNGQLTGQDGIHAFWESRLPELYADADYTFWVGPAQYVDDKESWFWDIVLTSHQLVDSVLLIEKDLRQAFPPDRQFCYEDRLGQTVRTQCADFAEAYHRRLGGMVEKRMQAAVWAVGCAWYSAWIDAGKPDLSEEAVITTLLTDPLEPNAPAGGFGREHE